MHYTVYLDCYKVYQISEKEDFCRCTMLINQLLVFYEVPHGLNWLIHMKVFKYVGHSSLTHFLDVYLKSGGNFRCSRGDCLNVVKGIIHRALMHAPDACFVVLGDFNKESNKVMKHLTFIEVINNLTPVFIMGLAITHFPLRGGKKCALDHILLNEEARAAFRNTWVHREYNASNHHSVMIYLRKEPLPSIDIPIRTSWDNKMIHLKGDLITNNNL